MAKGKMFVLSGPSGVGKSTIMKALLKKREDIFLSVSVTTREKRPGEEEGVNYYYKSQEDFLGMIERGEFLEWAQFCNNYYGTPKAKVEQLLSEGKDVILEIEIQGAMEVKKNFPDCVFIFIVPPNLEELVSRIQKRGTESSSIIALRMESAKKELNYAKEYHYILVNHSVEKTVEGVTAIVLAERYKMERCINDLEVLKK